MKKEKSRFFPLFVYESLVCGYPITSGVVSASVISDTCTFADGLATGFMVMGPGKGIARVNRIEGTEALIIIREKNLDYWRGFW